MITWKSLVHKKKGISPMALGIIFCLCNFISNTLVYMVLSFLDSFVNWKYLINNPFYLWSINVLTKNTVTEFTDNIWCTNTYRCMWWVPNSQILAFTQFDAPTPSSIWTVTFSQCKLHIRFFITYNMLEYSFFIFLPSHFKL